jgi:hypothetical protein
MHSARRPARLLLWSLILAIASCDGGGTTVDPDPDPRTPGALAIVSGRGQADSIQALLPQPLIVEVRDTRGVPLPGVQVTLTNIAATGDASPGRVRFAKPGSQVFAEVMAAQTGTDGRATFLVQTDTVAGIAVAQARTTRPLLTDTATLIVAPGEAVQIVASPRDTTILAPALYRLQAVGLDRYRNLRPVTRTPRARVTVVGDSVRMTQVGRGYVVLQSGALVDSAAVSAVPTGTIAFTHHREGTDAVAVMRLDHSQYREITVVHNPDGGSTYAPDWAPDGERLLLHTGSIIGLLWIFRANGEYLGSLNTYADSSEMWGDWTSSDWIYYSGTKSWLYGAPDRGAVIRARPNATGKARITAPATSEWHLRPRVSPDGRWLVYSNVISPYQMPFEWDGGTLVLMDLVSGAATSLNVSAVEGRWSPTGDRIAAVSDGLLVVIARDGSKRTIATGVNGLAEWSPDGSYLLTGCPNLCVVSVATGEKIPLSYASWRYAEPAWRR